jgi:hypothetical protein
MKDEVAGDEEGGLHGEHMATPVMMEMLRGVMRGLSLARRRRLRPPVIQFPLRHRIPLSS